MLLCARIRGQGARVRLGWCARADILALLLLPRRKRSMRGLHCLLTLSARAVGTIPKGRTPRYFGGFGLFYLSWFID